MFFQRGSGFVYYGIPFQYVDSTNRGTPKVPINFVAYGDESDPGPYPIPGN